MDAGESREARLAATLLAFGRRYSAIATPFEWRFTRLDLHRVLAAARLLDATTEHRALVVAREAVALLRTLLDAERRP